MTGEPTQLDFILEQVRQELRPPELGTVQDVYEHNSADDNSNHEVDVKIIGEDRTRRRLPVAVPTDGSARVPRGPDHPEGPDDVLVQFIKGNSESGVVTNVVPTTESRAPLGTAGDVRLSRGNLYVEMAGDGSVARIGKKPGDQDTPTATVEVDSQGAITIETEGDVTISAGGDVVIDEGGTAVPVAKQDHTHDYSGTTSDGATYNGTTKKPNEDGTATEIE